MNAIEREQSQYDKRLKRSIRSLVRDQLKGMTPWWFVSFHYRDNHTDEQKLILDVQDLKKKLRRQIFSRRDKSIKGSGAFPYPRVLFFHEQSHQGTGQFHTHLILERLPESLNTHEGVETLFRQHLPRKVKALSKWKSIGVQRINQDLDDYRCISCYLSKQSEQSRIVLDPFNSDLSKRIR